MKTELMWRFSGLVSTADLVSPQRRLTKHLKFNVPNSGELHTSFYHPIYLPHTLYFLFSLSRWRAQLRPNPTLMHLFKYTVSTLFSLCWIIPIRLQTWCYFSHLKTETKGKITSFEISFSSNYCFLALLAFKRFQLLFCFPTAFLQVLDPTVGFLPLLLHWNCFYQNNELHIVKFNCHCLDLILLFSDLISDLICLHHVARCDTTSARFFFYHSPRSTWPFLPHFQTPKGWNTPEFSAGPLFYLYQSLSYLT